MVSLVLGASVGRAQTRPELELTAMREAEREVERQPDPPATAAQAAVRDGSALGAETLDPAVAAQIQLPALELRMSPRLLRELALYQGDTRARGLLTASIRRAAAYRARVEQVLLGEGLPASLVWVVAAESAFNPRVCSPAGACGLWQFIPGTARAYGLRIDSWVDERRDPERATRAAARYLRDLHARFGTWELALAGYNMGPEGLARSVRKYNTNDFETLAAHEAGVPWETAHYVPRILGLAIATHNEAVFRLGRVAVDPVVTWEDVVIPRSVALADLARDARISEAQLRELNPALQRARVPPPVEGLGYTLHVPVGTAEAVRAAVGRPASASTRTYTVRLGEGLDEIAARYGLRATQLLALNGIGTEEPLAPGTVLVVPDREPEAVRAEVPVIAVDPAVVEGSGPRVFVRLGAADEPEAVARALGVSRSDLVAWNGLDPDARLLAGMWLQAWVRADPGAAVRVWREGEVEVVARGSEEFHNRAVEATGRVRQRITVREGDTLGAIAQRYRTQVGTLERINRRDRRAPLRAGETLVVYVEPGRDEAPPAVPATAATLPD